MAGGKTAVKRKSKRNAKRKYKSWSEQELKAFASVLASNENRDRPWARWKPWKKSSNESVFNKIREELYYGWIWKVPKTEMILQNEIFTVLSFSSV